MGATVEDLRLDALWMESLYRDQRVRLVRAAVLLVGDRAVAEDLVQEAFVNLWRSRDRLRDQAAATGYLYRSITNLAHSHRRRRGVADRHAHRAHQPSPGPEASRGVTDRAVLMDALGRLPHRQRECEVLRWYLDRSEREIAETLGISGGSVKTHLHRAMQTLATEVEVLR